MSEQEQVEKLHETLFKVEDLCDRLRQCLQIVECYISLLMMTKKHGVVEAKYLLRVKDQIAKMGQLAMTIMSTAHTETPENNNRHLKKSGAAECNIKLPTLLEIMEGREIEVKEPAECEKLF